MRLNKNESGFTLLEIIIVIIIIGILASLALPKFFKTVEYSRSAEALTTLGSIRRAMDICYQPTRQYTPCNSFNALSLEDPGTYPNAHWTYGLGTPGSTTYIITATRSTVDGGLTADTIAINQDGGKTGSGSFLSIR